MPVLQCMCKLSLPCLSKWQAGPGISPSQLFSCVTQVPNGDGALALHVMPRYVLHNNLKQALQYKQQVWHLSLWLVACAPALLYVQCSC